MLQQGKYVYAPTAEAVPQYLEDYDTGGVWGGKEDNLVWPTDEDPRGHLDFHNLFFQGKGRSWTSALGHHGHQHHGDQRQHKKQHRHHGHQHLGQEQHQHKHHHEFSRAAAALGATDNRQDRAEDERELFEMDTSERDTLDHNQESEHFCNGGDSCCQNRPWHRCGIGEGDCDQDTDCERGLVCGKDNCQGSGFDSTDDCCRDPCDGGDSCCRRNNVCKEGEGDCDSDTDCEGDLKCGKDNCRGLGFDSTDDCCHNPLQPWGEHCEGGDSCCTLDKPCFEGEGDCDEDSECRGSLRCGTDNCYGEGFDDTDDCCTRPWQ